MVRTAERVPRFFVAQIQDLPPRPHGESDSLGREVGAQGEGERQHRWLAAVVAHSSDAIIGVNAEGRIFSWSAGAERLFGYSPDEVAGAPISLLAPDATARFDIEQVTAQAVAGMPLQEYDAVRRRKDGSLVDVHVHVRRVEDREGGAIGWSVTARDISERRRLTDTLMRQADTYRAIARSLPGACVTVFDRDLRWVAVEGEELLARLGTTKEALVGKFLVETLRSEDRERLAAIYTRALEGVSTELDVERTGRSLIVRVAPLQGADGENVGGLVVSWDVTAQRAQGEELRRAKLLLDATITNIEDGVALLDSGRRLLFANDAYLTLFDIQRSEMRGLRPDQLLERVAHGLEDRARWPRGCLALRPVSRSPTRSSFVSPHRRVMRRTIKPVGVGGESGYLVVWRDITWERALLAERDKEARTDALTGIANRRAADMALLAAAATLDRSPVSVALFDIDHFKAVNDRHGHQAGDRVLTAVAKVLVRQARDGNVVARWGGEEFIAIMPTNLEGAKAFCERCDSPFASSPSPVYLGSLSRSASRR